VIDALRGDRVNTKTMPFLSQISGTTTAISPATWTFPSVTSIATGKYPHQHGAMRQSDSPDLTDGLPPKLPRGDNTLADYFSAAGYETYGGFAFGMPLYAIGGTFKNHSLYNDCQAESDNDAEAVLSDYLSWLRKHPEKRTFAYIHLADLHSPVNPPKEYWRQYNVDDSIPNITRWGYQNNETGETAERYKKNRRRLYDAAANYVDTILAETMEKIPEIIGSEPTTIVTSDHGELFWEHVEFDREHFSSLEGNYGLAHGGTPYEELTRVPILSNTSDFEGKMFSTIDIAPMLLSASGISIPSQMTGLPADRNSDDRHLLTEASRYGFEKKAIYSGDWKLLVSEGDNKTLSFSLPKNEWVEMPASLRQELQSELPPWPDGGEMNEVSDITKKRLQKLGYME